MNPDNQTVAMKVNQNALELPPKRNATRGAGRPPQASNLAGMRATVIRRTVSTVVRAAEVASYGR